MASKKLFNGLANNIAHHAQSGLSYLHPHLGESCRKIGVETVSLDLLGQPTYPLDFFVSEPLERATKTLIRRFEEMAAKVGVELSQLRTAVLYFDRASKADTYSFDVRSEFELSDGTKYSQVVKLFTPEPSAQEKIPGTDLLWPKRKLR